MKKTISLIDESGKYRSLASIEKEVILTALENHNYNMADAAAALHMGRTTIYRKLEAMGYELSSTTRLIKKK